jgi:flagellar motor switch protein FliM
VGSETLSQQEIDKLLGPQDPAGGSRDPHGSADAPPYDFRRPHRMSKERLRTLEAMYEQVVKSLEGWLMGRVRGQIEMKLRSVEQFSFGEFALSLPTPCASFMVSVEDSGGQMGIIEFGRELCGFLVDRLFGGSTEPAVPERGLTPIERMAVRIVAERLTGLLEDAWKDHIPLKLELTGFESIPEILFSGNRDGTVLVATVAVKAAGVDSLLLLCLPAPVLEKFFSSARDQKVNSRLAPQQPRDREVTESMLRSTHVKVAARLPDFRIGMRDLAALRVGGVLSTGIPVDAELTILVNGQKRFRAAAGRSGRRMAMRITADFSSEDGLHPTISADDPA